MSSLRFVTACAALLLSSLGWAQGEAVPLTRLSTGDIGGWIVVPVVAGDHAGRWLLDTGATHNLVSRAFARQLALSGRGTVKVETPRGSFEGDEVQLPTLQVGAVSKRAQTALAMDLRPIFGDAGDVVDGVIGVPFLDDLQVDIDLRNSTSRWRRQTDEPCPADSSPVVVQRHRTLPVVSIGHAGGDRTELYVLDTGSQGGVTRIESEPVDPSAPGLPFPGGLKLALLSDITLGPQVRSAVPVARRTNAKLRATLGNIAGFAGAGLFDGARWRLDFSRNQICVEAGRFETPGGFGMTLERKDGLLKVALVLPGGPAEGAGLRTGETITAWTSGVSTAAPLLELWGSVRNAEQITFEVGEPPRAVTLKRSLFLPLSPR